VRTLLGLTSNSQTVLITDGYAAARAGREVAMNCRREGITSKRFRFHLQ
jgi:hypothetical protein